MFAPLCCGCCYAFLFTSHLLPFSHFHRQIKEKIKNFFDYFLWALSCCFRWMAELSFHNKKTKTTQLQRKLYNFLYLCCDFFCVFFILKIKELIMEVFKSRTKLLLFLLLSIGKKDFLWFWKITWLQINQLKFNSEFLCCVFWRGSNNWLKDFPFYLLNNKN